MDTWLQVNKLFLNFLKMHSILISTQQKYNFLNSQSQDNVTRKCHDLQIPRLNAEYAKRALHIRL